MVTSYILNWTGNVRRTWYHVYYRGLARTELALYLDLEVVLLLLLVYKEILSTSTYCISIYIYSNPSVIYLFGGYFRVFADLLLDKLLHFFCYTDWSLWFISYSACCDLLLKNTNGCSMRNLCNLCYLPPTVLLLMEGDNFLPFFRSVVTKLTRHFTLQPLFTDMSNLVMCHITVSATFIFIMGVLQNTCQEITQKSWSGRKLFAAIIRESLQERHIMEQDQFWEPCCIIIAPASNSMITHWIH